jgi:hypothetical protein
MDGMQGMSKGEDSGVTLRFLAWATIRRLSLLNWESLLEVDCGQDQEICLKHTKFDAKWTDKIFSSIHCSLNKVAQIYTVLVEENYIYHF